MSIYTNKMRYNSLIPLTSDEKTLNNWFFQFFGPQKTPKTINRPKALKKISLRDFFDCFNLNRIRKTREEGRCANLNYNFLYWFSIQFLQSRPNFAVSKQETIHFFHEEKAKYHFLNMSHKFFGFFNLQKNFLRSKPEAAPAANRLDSIRIAARVAAIAAATRAV